MTRSKRCVVCCCLPSIIPWWRLFLEVGKKTACLPLFGLMRRRDAAVGNLTPGKQGDCHGTPCCKQGHFIACFRLLNESMNFVKLLGTSSSLRAVSTTHMLLQHSAKLQLEAKRDVNLQAADA